VRRSVYCIASFSVCSLRRAKSIGETYILGDQPLVTLTALQASFHPTPSSSTYVTRPAPIVNDSGSYDENPTGRPIRVYTHTDVRLTFQDLFEKLDVFANNL
jgi:hypothetical protein